MMQNDQFAVGKECKISMRIVGIGVDLIEIDRVAGSYANPSFQKKYYTEEEQKLIRQKYARCATAFAGKEAVVKAFGTGFTKISPKEIEIVRSETGAPLVRLYGRAEEKAKELGICEIQISLADDKTQAMAYVIAIGREERNERLV